jgi:cytochrome oxidase Cu insertion factor (SCO1/SenC/PrrC family)
MRPVSISAPTMAVLVLVLYGCHWPQSRKTEAEPQQVAAVGVGQSAPDIDGEDMNGQRLHLADYKGQVVVLHFWANW